MDDTDTNASGDAKSTEQRLAELEDGHKVAVQVIVGGLKDCIEAFERVANSKGDAERSEKDALNELVAKLKGRAHDICKQHPNDC